MPSLVKRARAALIDSSVSRKLSRRRLVLLEVRVSESGRAKMIRSYFPLSFWRKERPSLMATFVVDIDNVAALWQGMKQYFIVGRPVGIALQLNNDDEADQECACNEQNRLART